MSLKAEQHLLNHQFTEFEPKIYATGVYLVPMKIEIQGTEKWIWVAEEFESDTYFDGKNIAVNVISDNLKNLLVEE
jgi:hypothetical protein